MQNRAAEIQHRLQPAGACFLQPLAGVLCPVAAPVREMLILPDMLSRLLL